MATSDRDQAPTAQLARDEFTVRRRELDNTPEAVKTSNRIDIVDPTTTEITTWIVDQYRFDGRVTMFLQVGKPDGGYIRLLVPAKVMAAIARADDSLVSKQRRQTARRVVEDRIARGDKLGNPEALAAARRVPRGTSRKRRRRARKQAQA